MSFLFLFVFVVFIGHCFLIVVVIFSLGHGLFNLGLFLILFLDIQHKVSTHHYGSSTIPYRMVRAGRRDYTVKVFARATWNFLGSISVLPRSSHAVGTRS